MLAEATGHGSVRLAGNWGTIRVRASVRQGWLGLAAAFVAAMGVIAAPMGSRAEQSAPFRVSDAEKSVVRVVVLLFDANNQFLAASVGSGFVVAPERVMTNHHVIEGEGVTNVARREVFIVPDPHSGRQRVTGQILRDSTDPDLALIRAPGLTAPVMRIAAVFPDKDAVIHALGFPGVTDRILNRTPQEMMAPSEPSVTAGSIALFSDRGPGGSHVPTIFHTAFINPGNSGGPLIDPCGRIIGINTWSGTATMSAEGVSVPQGQFIAIQSTALTRFLASAGINNAPETDACIPPIDPRIQSMVQQQQAELGKLREDRAREAAQTQRNFLIGGGLLVILLGGGVAVVLLRRRGPPAPPPYDPTSGAWTAPTPAPAPPSAPQSPPVSPSMTEEAPASPPLAAAAQPLPQATLAPEPTPLADAAGAPPPSAPIEAYPAAQPPPVSPPPGTLPPGALPPLGLPPGAPPSGGPPVGLLIAGGLAVLVILGGVGVWRVVAALRHAPPASQTQQDAPPVTAPAAALHGTYSMTCTARSAGGQDVSVVIDVDRGCVDQNLAYERTSDGFVRLQLDTVTGTITRLSISSDLTTYTRSLFAPPRDQFDRASQAGAAPAACAAPGDQAAQALLTSQMRALRMATQSLLTRPGAVATWRCTPSQSAPMAAPQIIPAPTPIPGPNQTNTVPDQTPPEVDTPPSVDTPPDSPPEARPEPPSREPEPPQADKPSTGDDPGVDEEPPMEDPEEPEQE